MLVLTGIDNSVAMAREGEPRGGHGRVAPAFLTGVHARPTIGADFQAGTSLDQIAARHLGRDTQLASLELAVDAPEFGGTCDTGFSCVYTNTISWRTPTEPLPMENNPRIVFERMFGDSGSTNPAARRRAAARAGERARRDHRQGSAVCSASVGSADRAKLDEYLESIREIERRHPEGGGAERARAAAPRAAGRRSRRRSRRTSRCCSISRCWRSRPT